MAATDQQVRLLKMNYEKTGCIETASAKAGLCRQTVLSKMNEIQEKLLKALKLTTN